MSNAALSAVWKHSQATGATRLLLLAIADEANDDGLLAAYKRSQVQLAKKMHAHVRTVPRAVEAAVALGELTVVQQGGGSTEATYQLCLPTLGEMPGPTPGKAPGVPPAARQGTPGSTPPPTPGRLPGLLPTSNNPPSPLHPVVAAEHADGFAAFWLVYPRKVDKPAAERAYRRARVAADHPSIMEGLARWADYWRRQPDSTSFTPYPATWLNGRRWQDNPAALHSARQVGGRRIDQDRDGPSGVVQL